MTYNVFGGTLSLTQSINHCHFVTFCMNGFQKLNILHCIAKWLSNVNDCSIQLY